MTYGEAPARNARFVQIIQGRVADVSRLIEVSKQSEQYLRTERPDLLGYIAGVEKDGTRCVQAAYFTDEATARQGESQPPSEEMQKLFQEEQSLFQDTTYVDLRDPWVHVR
jgi:hypothetical protein